MGWDERMRLRRQAPDSVAVLTRGDAPGEPRALCRRELAAQACGMSCTKSPSQVSTSAVSQRHCPPHLQGASHFQAAVWLR